MDSVENFQFNEDGPPQMNVPGFSFDGIGSAGLDSDGLFQGSLGTWKEGGSKSLEDVLATVRKRTRPVGAEAERRRTRGQTAEARKGRRRKKTPDIDEEDLRAAEALSRRREGMQSAQRRKKMYVDFLKQHHGDSKGEEEDLPPKKKASSKRKVELDTTDVHEASLRRALILNFLKYRSATEVNEEKWRDLVADDFQLLLPREPYRVAFGAAVTPNTQRITGLEQLLDDTRSIGALAEMIRARCWRLKQLDAKARQVRVQKAQDEASKALEGSDDTAKARAVVHAAKEQLACVSEDLNANAFSSIKVVYACNAREILVSGPLLMCAWRFETSGLRRVGFPSEVSVSGMLKARFREDDGSTKLHRIELAFDCMAVMQQLNAHGLLDVAAIAQAAATARKREAEDAKHKPPPRKRAKARKKAGEAPGALDAQASLQAKQRQQQLLAQCMPYVANYSYKLALLRHRQSSNSNGADLTPEQRSQLLAAAAAARPAAAPAPSLTPQQLLLLQQQQLFGRQPGYSSPYAPPAPAPLLPVGAPPIANPAAAQMMAAYFAQVAAQARGPPAPAPGAPAPVEAEPAPAPAAS